ncbi:MULTISPECIES: helix-turn-helix domain-containing protein [Pseudonocardia]|uniref:HTH cro/C1-type domain-containing protein n=2 Tax=Pseudonocardia TaxID=1847 RepID=A0A1Y2N1J4_PSEAH|nr:MULTISPECIES: helix-turn-helix domain-containing protein [Pseudonocardia]OSY41320.1 hypothetical protein BG845_02222 [Pseudonocardia autotrophica]TDN76776.1 helix-turn-helix protein [Pseudonocardia autotrophica]BBG00777.1 hypothetical protein Pdca_19860 [Pseudonocardia autotrophica]GEC24257.1 hypothetical protein PSA01_12860 [Pseudonocardia saturnea]
MHEHPEDGLAHAIRAARRTARISQAELANLAGFSREYVSRSERPSAGLASRELVSAIDAALGCGGDLVALRARLHADRVARRRAPGECANGATAEVAPGSDRFGDPVEVEVEPDSASTELVAIQHAAQVTGPDLTLSATVDLVGRIDAGLTRYRSGSDRDRLLRSGALVAEYAGFVCRDAGLAIRCLFWHDRAMEYALRAGDTSIQAYVLLRKSQAAYDRRDAHRLADLALAAERVGTSATPSLRAEIIQQRARGEAMLGAGIDRVNSLLDRAAHLRATGLHDQDAAPGPALFDIQVALCWSESGRPRHAVRRFGEVDTLGMSTRDRAYVSILSARSLALSGEPDEAASVTTAALPVAAAAGSRRSVLEACGVLEALKPWRSRQPVYELALAVRSARELLDS